MNREELHELILRAKKNGFSDWQLGHLWGLKEPQVRELRKSFGIEPVYKTVDTCGAEFEAETPYHYSTYEMETEVRPTEKTKVMILGGGPNRIGQGIEFDYCCCHAVFALQEDGYETIMVNSNPETVSTDYDTADRLYFEPLTFEDVMNIIEAEQPWGVIVQLGGQTPLKLSVSLERAGVNLLGTSSDSIDLAEDRQRFGKLVDDLGIPIPSYGTARSYDEALRVAERIGFPVLVRPSYVLGGRAMEIVYDKETLSRYMDEAVRVSPEHPILVDQYLDGAIEFDVDALCDQEKVFIGGIMQHVEYAGVHSGDSACVLPPLNQEKEVLDTLRDYTRKLALALKVKGLINIQFAVQRGEDGVKVFVLEVNPRASRTVPFVSKATGIPLAKMAARIMVGKTLEELGLKKEPTPKHISVKEAVLPFIKFQEVDTLLGPEMKSTGEVMGIDKDFGLAFAKSQFAAGTMLPSPGDKKQVFISVSDPDKERILEAAGRLQELGFSLIATGGTSKFLAAKGIACDKVYKVNEGRPNIVDKMVDGEISLVINTPLGKETEFDEKSIRRTAVEYNIPYVTTVAAASAAVEGISALANHEMDVKALQDYHKEMGTAEIR